MIKHCRFIILFFVVFVLSMTVFAQTGKKEKPKKRTTINFEDQLIKGEKQMPDLLYMLQKKKFNYKRLIRLRDDFIPEMEETGTEIEEIGKSSTRKKK